MKLIMYNSIDDLPICHLPTLLQKVVEVFSDPFERLLVLYSAIVGIGGTLTKVIWNL